MKRPPGPKVTAFRYDEIFNEAVREAVRAKSKLLTHYIVLARTTIKPLPRDYLFDLRAFCVLASAVLEQCAEDLAWANAFEMCDEINRYVATGRSRTLANASGLLRDYVEGVVLRTHGIKEDQFQKIVSGVGINVKLTGNQTTSFEQLGRMRGESAHTYAVGQKSPQEVWDYVRDVLAAIRSFALSCSGGTGSFISV